MHRDIQKYPLVPIITKFQGQKHRGEAAVSPHLTHPLILGTHWAGFQTLVREVFMEASCGSESRGGGWAALAGEVLPGLSMSAPHQEGTTHRKIPLGDFSLEQTRDKTLRHTFDQVKVFNGQ